MSAQLPSERSEESFVEFHGKRSQDFRVDEAKYWVYHERVNQLRSELMPVLPDAIVLLDLLLCFPLALTRIPGGSPVPFRLRILEDMLDQDCWEAESESEMLEGLAIQSGSDEEELAAGSTTIAPDGDHAAPEEATVSHRNVARAGKRVRR